MAFLEVSNIDTLQIHVLTEALFNQQSITPISYHLKGNTFNNESGALMVSEEFHLTVETHTPKTKKVEIDPITIFERVRSVFGYVETKEVEYTEKNLYRITGELLYPTDKTHQDTDASLKISYYDVYANHKWVLKRLGSALSEVEEELDLTPLSLYKSLVEASTTLFHEDIK